MTLRKVQFPKVEGCKEKQRPDREDGALLNNSERSDQVPSGDLGGIDKEKALSLLKAKRPSPLRGFRGHRQGPVIPFFRTPRNVEF